MKKNFLWVALAAIAMASCTSDEVSIADQQKQEATAQGLMPINLSLSTTTASVSETRSTGTVGDSTAALNNFNYEDIYVLMMDITGGAEHPWAYTNCGGTLGEQFNNTFFCRPELNALSGTYSLEYNGFAGSAGGTMKYYPMNGDSDFFGYYIDDAATATTPAGNPDIKKNDAGDAYELAFNINGKQDIMAGKATNYYVGRNYDDTADSTYNGFSNKTARKNHIPTIDMKHMLTRFTFEIKAGDDGNNLLFIDSIGITSEHKGKLTVATSANWDYENLVVWDDSHDIDTLFLDKKSSTAATLIAGKQPTETIDTVFIGTKDSQYPVGDALFVKPGETSHQLHLKLHQIVTGATGAEEQWQWAKIPIRRKDNLTFERGKSYHVLVTVYGMHEIVIETTLEQWQWGEEIPVNTDMSL